MQSNFIYMVEMILNPALTRDDWLQWESDMKSMEEILTVPGFQTAQRFEGANVRMGYCGIYAISDPNVMSSAAYGAIGGGTMRAKSWKPQITLWQRNLLRGEGTIPAPGKSEFLAVCDLEPGFVPVPDVSFEVFDVVGLDQSTRKRGMAILTTAEASQFGPQSSDRIRVYKPTSEQLRPQGARAGRPQT